MVVAAVACNGILGIGSATLDPDEYGQDAAGGGPETAVDPGLQTPCQAYCNAVLTNCPNAEYDNAATCLALCTAFDPGQPGDTSQDSLGCRAHYAQLAATGLQSEPPQLAPPAAASAAPTSAPRSARSTRSRAPEPTPRTTAACCGATARGTNYNFTQYLTDAGNDLTLSTGKHAELPHLAPRGGGEPDRGGSAP